MVGFCKIVTYKETTDINVDTKQYALNYISIHLLQLKFWLFPAMNAVTISGSFLI